MRLGLRLLAILWERQYPTLLVRFELMDHIRQLLTVDSLVSRVAHEPAHAMFRGSAARIQPFQQVASYFRRQIQVGRKNRGCPGSGPTMVAVAEVASQVFAVACESSFVFANVAAILANVSIAGLAVAVSEISLQVFAVASESSFVFANIAAILANVAIARLAITVSEVSLQVFAVAGESSFIFANIASVLANVAISVAETAAKAARGLQIVNDRRQLLSLDAIVGEHVDNRPKSVLDRRAAEVEPVE